MYLAELPWRRGCSVIRCAPRGLFSFLSVFFNKAPFGLPPIGYSSYSRVAISSVLCAQNIYFSAQTRGAPLSLLGRNSHNMSFCPRKVRWGRILSLVPDDESAVRDIPAIYAHGWPPRRSASPLGRKALAIMTSLILLILYYTALYCTVLYCTVLYYTVL